MKTHHNRTLLKVAGTGVFLLGLAALAVVIAPAARGQVEARDAPSVQIRTLLGSGSAIGVELRDVDEADVRREGLPEPAGAVVAEVGSNGPAAAAGFRAGDVVVTFDGERVRSARQLSRLIEDTPDGRVVPVVVIRDGNRVELSVAPAPPESVFAGPLRDWQDYAVRVPRSLERLELPRDLAQTYGTYVLSGRSRLGVTVSELTDQLGEYFGASSGGMLVTSVSEGTPAEAAGLRAGDVIARVAGQPVRTAGELQRRIADVSGEVELTVVRDRREQTIRATIERQELVRRPSARVRR